MSARISKTRSPLASAIQRNSVSVSRPGGRVEPIGGVGSAGAGSGRGGALTPISGDPDSTRGVGHPRPRAHLANRQVAGTTILLTWALACLSKLLGNGA